MADDFCIGPSVIGPTPAQRSREIAESAQRTADAFLVYLDALSIVNDWRVWGPVAAPLPEWFDDGTDGGG